MAFFSYKNFPIANGEGRELHQSFSDSSSESSLKTSLKQQIKTPKSKEKSKILIATIKTLLAIIPKKRINPANIKTISNTEDVSKKISL